MNLCYASPHASRCSLHGNSALILTLEDQQVVRGGLGGPQYGAAAGTARAIAISNALEHSIGREQAGIRQSGSEAAKSPPCSCVKKWEESWRRHGGTTESTIDRLADVPP
jgi:hypothetical protein